MTINRKKIIPFGGIELSQLGFGCMRFPWVSDGVVDYDAAKPLIDRAMASGINYYDTAAGYPGSEEFLGKALTEYDRDTYYLATKSLPLRNQADLYMTFRAQLKRLRTDHIDFYLVHNPFGEDIDRMVSYRVIDKLLKKKQTGEIGFLGFSFHGTIDTFSRLLAIGCWDFIQLQLNYFDDHCGSSEELLRLATEKRLPVTVMEPLLGGRLVNLPDDVNTGNANLAGTGFRYVANKDNIAVILSGMNDMTQLDENVKIFSADMSLTDTDLTTISVVRKYLDTTSDTKCTYCRYCVGKCPMGIDIPALLTLPRIGRFVDNPLTTLGKYNVLGAQGTSIDRCIRCKKCEAVCPQHITVTDEFKRIKRYLSELGSK